MTATNIWIPIAVKIGSTVFGQLTDAGISDDVREIVGVDPLRGYVCAAGIDGHDCRIQFTTNAVKAALAKFGLAGVSLTAEAPGVLYLGNLANGRLVVGGCKTLTFSKGVGVWRSLNAPEGGLASAACELVGVSANGTDHPAALGSNQAIPDAPAAEQYAAGTATGGEGGLQSFSIDTGIALHLARGDGQLYPTVAGIGATIPRGRWRQTEAPAAFGGETSYTALVLRDVVAGGGRGNAPITFTFTKPLGAPRRIGGSPGISEFEVIGAQENANLPIVITGIT